MRIIKVLSFLLTVVTMISSNFSAVAGSTVGEPFYLTESDVTNIKEIVENNMLDGQIPGVSLVIVKGKKVIYSEGFGFSDVKNKIAVTPDTFFELGSNSKAFTGLAILNLEKEGLIDLNAPINKYIPWLVMEYDGKEADITVAQVMSHRSGIPFKSIDKIPVGASDTALKDTLHTLVNSQLQSLPGETYSYATINYDILGYMIETLTSQSYEEYILENVLNPIGLKNTYMFKEHIPSGGVMSKGYKVGFFQPQEYDAPVYRGNKPAGYIISNANDMGKWITAQLNFNEESIFDQELITKSHEFGMSLPNNTGLYAVGWFADTLTNEIYHGGNNPNFSSKIVLDLKNEVGVAVLANSNSAFTNEIASNVMDIIQKKEMASSNITDIYIEIDRISVFIVCIAVVAILIMAVLIYRLVMEIIKKQRVYTIPKLKTFISMFIGASFLCALWFIVYKIPEWFINGVTWKTAIIWTPQTLLLAVILVGISTMMAFIYLAASMLYKKDQSLPYFYVILLSLISGMGNALIIFMINESLKAEVGFQSNLLLIFILGIVAYVGSSRLVRTKLVQVTNQIVYKLRVDLIKNILNTSFENLEKLEEGTIQSTLNNDTETVSNFANMIITLITNVVTLLCCFTYLGFINLYAMLVSIITIAIIVAIYFGALKSSRKLLEEARTTQNIFFKFINDMIDGFKELRLNIKRQKEFEKDITQISYTYTQKRGKAFLTFANVFVLGELVFTLAVGFIVFFFPVIFKDIKGADLRSYVFVLLYLTGPVHNIMNIIPNLVQVKISWDRVNKLLKEVSENAEKEELPEEGYEENKNINLKLQNVEYKYDIENAEQFKIGPINYEFNSGEIIFITGGNGSGKSTLAKIITGLYRVQNGYVLINNQHISSKELEQKYAAIFGDFHLFDKLYGIDYGTKIDEFNHYLKIMQLSDKIELKDGSLNTTKLSTGQRKRLALAISYLEDRPIYLFDEWAADQDPEFREFFYKNLLLELREKGKCVIVITHDDRYFNIADKIIKMDLGNIVNQ